uniref:Uncharacterized protein n=1 Tax=Rhizophora mucronata TaxID=61149 RepID=A0A2P2LA20_RHIMU
MACRKSNDNNSYSFPCFCLKHDLVKLLLLSCWFWSKQSGLL